MNFKNKNFFEKIIYLENVDSTNSFIKTNIKHFKTNSVIYSNNQTNGKGSKGRKFITIKNKSVAMSFLIKNVEINILRKFPLIAAVSCLLSLKSLKIPNSKIKWLNDILINDKKIAGILCESIISNGKSNIIIGIGVNVLEKSFEFEKLNLNKAGSLLSETKQKFSLEAIFKVFKTNIEETVKNFMAYGEYYFNLKILEKYKENCITIGQLVKIYDSNKYITTLQAKDISNDGALLCTNANGNIFKIDGVRYSATIIK